MKFNKETTKKLRSWLKKNNFQVGCRLGKEMAYYPTENYIEVGYDYSDELDMCFMKWLHKNGLKADYNVVTLSYLHELGHFVTVSDFTDDEWTHDSILKDLICSYEDELTTEKFVEINFAYWNTPTEKMANLFAIDFTETHKAACDELEAILKGIM